MSFHDIKLVWLLILMKRSLDGFEEGLLEVGVGVLKLLFDEFELGTVDLTELKLSDHSIG